MSREDFDKIDTDNDGYITADELKESMKDNVETDDVGWVSIVRSVDEDGDRKISYDEYAKFVE